MTCPECGGECERDEVDNGVGMEACGRWGCPDCQWVQPEIRIEENPREKGDDDGVEYGDPREARAGAVAVMASHLLQPGDIPKPVTKAERRRWASAERDDEVRAQRGDRPNAAPRPGLFTDCPMSKFSQHRFVARGGRACEFCGKNYEDCLRSKGGR